VLGGVLACDSSPASVESAHDLLAVAASNSSFPLNAVVSFGQDDVGSVFPPPSGHDQSFHAKDKVRPHLVHIAAGGSVTFQMGTFHNVAIYQPGIEPADIDASITVDLLAPSPPAPPGTVIIPNFLIDDATGRLAVGPFSFAPLSWTSPPGTFNSPGTYLVICRVVPHFVGAKMYAWVVVS
jgi:plastocyanin